MGSGVKECTFPLCCIFNKAKHAGNCSPFNYHISFLNGPFTLAEFTDFAHSSRIIGNINCNIDQMFGLYAVFLLFSPFFGETVCMLGI